MSKNNQIKKSDKKFIRTEKARIRRTFLDVKKQQELIDGLYKRFEPKTETKEVKETKKETVEPKKAEVKKEKVVKKAKAK